MKQTQYIKRDTFSWIMPLFIVAFLCVLPTANADVGERFLINDIRYRVVTEDSENRTVSVIAYSGEPTAINIPDSVVYNDKTYTVTIIDNMAFNNCSSLFSITLPDSLITIGNYGFADCINLSHITIPDNVTSIGDRAFQHCYSLSSITFGNSLVSIGKWVFNDCWNLANITVNTDNPIYSSEDGILFNKDKTVLIKYPFGRKETRYTTPNYITTIGNNAFENCRNLISVTISDSVTHIKNYAFSNCYNLKDVVVGKNVSTIGGAIFDKCSTLKHVYYKGNGPNSYFDIYYTTPETLTSYYDPENEESWASVIWGNDTWNGRRISNIYGVDYIYNENGTASVVSIAFTKETDITIPANVEKDGISYTVTSISDNAFEFSNIPTSITIPASITSIGRNVFSYCDNLKAIYVASENPVYSSVDGVLFNKEQTMLIQYPSGRDGEYIIPAGIHSIKSSAFLGCTASLSLIISEGVEVIEPNTFYKLKGLQSIQLPSTLKIIGEDAFFGCVNLMEISISDSVISIGAGAFANCRSLEQVDIPPYVEEIGDSAFYRCEKLRFAYIPDSLVEVGAYMFNYCHSLESVIIGSGIQYIQDGAFLNCENLNAVYFLGYHPELGYEAFLISEYFRIIRDSQNPKLEPQTNPEVYLEALRENTPVLYYLNDRLGWYPLSQEEALNVIRNCDTWSDLGTALDRCLNYTELEANTDDFDISEGTILSYKGNSPVVVVPDRINGTTVTQIGENAFANSVGVFIIIIPGSVEMIGDKAFANCTSLQTVQFRGNAPEAAENIFEGDHCVVYCENGTIGWDAVWKGVAVLSVPASSADDFTYEINNNEITITGYPGTASHLEIPSEIEGYPVTQIKEEAFFGRFNIFSVSIPKSVTYVGFGAFANCRNLHSAKFEGETEIEDSAFYHCRNLLEITLPKGLEEVKAYTFTGCNMLQEIDLPSSLTYIGDSSFYKCASLQNIVIPQNVTEIGDSVFAWCEGLTNVVVPDSITSIGSFVFNGCDQLPPVLFSTEKKILIRYSSSNTETSYTIPDTVTYIAGSAFFKCTNLESIKIPNTVTDIGDNAFSGLLNLVDIEIPNSITSIGNCLFGSCSSLENIVIPDNIAYIGDNAFFGCNNLTNVTICNGVISIGNNAFCKCSSLTSITIPESVTEIGDYVFSNCNSLTSVTIPNSVTAVGNYAFSYCRSLPSITIPDSVTEMGQGTFYNCSNLESVDIGKCINSSIEHTMFSGCTNLVNITISLENPVYSSRDGVIFNKNQSQLVLCPTGRTDAYALPNSVTSIRHNAFYNCNNLTSIIIPESVTSIGNEAFYNCNNLTSIIIPENITEIGDYMFCNCISLPNIIIPDNVISIGNGAFYNCRSLTSIIIPDSVTSIGNESFYNCISMTNVTIGNSVISIGGNAFNSCHGLTSITIPESVTEIGDAAFFYCINLINVTLPDSVTSIGDHVFHNCMNLKNINIPNSVTSIGNYAFYNCNVGLTSITIPDSVTSIGNRTFAECSSLTNVYFKGDAPILLDTLAFASTYATIYYIEGTKGWTNPWGRRPTVMIRKESLILTCTLEENMLLLQWPADTDAVLQVSDDSGNGWSDVIEGIQTEVENRVYIVPKTKEKSFYRLKIQ